MGKRKFYKNKKKFKRKVPYNKTKKMVTGQGPTMLETIANGVGSVAQIAQAVMPAIMAINTELKYSDIAASGQVAYQPGTNDYIASLTYNLAQGTQDYERIGNSVLAKEIYVKASVAMTASTTVHATQSRLMLIVWKENEQNNPPTIAKIFENPSDLRSAINKDYSDQFVVLKDKWYSHNATISAASTQSIQLFKFYKKLDFHLRWDGATTSDATQNHIYLIFRGSSPISANQSVISYYSRFNFTDN